MAQAAILGISVASAVSSKWPRGWARIDLVEVSCYHVLFQMLMEDRRNESYIHAVSIICIRPRCEGEKIASYDRMTVISVLEVHLETFLVLMYAYAILCPSLRQ